MNGIITPRSFNDENDKTIRTIKEEKELLHSDLTRTILGCCFEVMGELGPGFLERVYKNALFIAMMHKGLQVDTERSYEVIFRGKIVGRYAADLVVNNTVIIELKCCENLISEHQAQLFNYLKVSGLSVGLLVNFRRRKLEWKRLQNNEEDPSNKSRKHQNNIDFIHKQRQNLVFGTEKAPAIRRSQVSSYY